MSRRVAVIPMAFFLTLCWHAPAQDTTKDETTRLRQEVEQLRKQLATQTQQATEQDRKIAELRRQLVEVQLPVETLLERNQQLLADQEVKAKAFQKLREAWGDTPKKPLRKPPDEEMEGSITAVNKSGHMTLNVGSKAGLQVGHTLEVFRLKPEGKYLGTLEILEVRETSAVAKPLGKLKPGATQIGDRVASRIQ